MDINGILTQMDAADAMLALAIVALDNGDFAAAAELTDAANDTLREALR